MLFSLKHGRWLTVRELLLAQAFPVMDTSGAILGRGRRGPQGPQGLPGGLCSFNLDRTSFGFGERKRSAVSEQVGNSMNVNAIGAAFLRLFGFTDCMRPDRSDLETSGIAERVAKRRRGQDMPGTDGGLEKPASHCYCCRLQPPRRSYSNSYSYLCLAPTATRTSTLLHSTPTYDFYKIILVSL